MRSIARKYLAGLLLLAALVLTVNSSAQAVGGHLNPLQVGLLAWYGGSQPNSIGVGVGPNAVAFNGANIWVANASGNNVTKLRASDGAVFGTFPDST